MIAEIFFRLLVFAFLYSVYRFGIWLYADPIRAAEKLAYYDQYLKPGRVMQTYLRALGAFFSWLPIFAAGAMLLSYSLEFSRSSSLFFVYFPAMLAWLATSVWIHRKLRTQIKVSEPSLPPNLPN